MVKTNLCKELKNHTEILDSTFEKRNLRVINFSYSQYSESDFDCRACVEIAAIEGDSIDNSVHVKINFYDVDGDLISAFSEAVYRSDFSGYDTVTIICDDNGKLLLAAKKARIYAA